MRRLVRISAYGLFLVLAVLLIVALAVYVRLLQGPVSLDFMRSVVENRINQNLPDMKASIGGVVIERSPDTRVPHVRLINVVLKDKDGNPVARAPRAGIGISEQALLSGSIVPTSIELIGPKISVMRKLEGNFALGFDEPAPEDQSVNIDTSESGKSDRQPPANPADGLSSGAGAALIQLLSGGPNPSGNTIGSIEMISVRNAAIVFYDEANDARWNIPASNFDFSRTPDGFHVGANAVVSNGREQGNWTANFGAEYRRDTGIFTINADIDDLVPGYVSDEIFALSKLARVEVPLTGHVAMEVTDTGLVTRATGEFTAGRGKVAFPDYLAETLDVNSGSLRADYDPVTGSIVITDSSLVVGRSRAEVKGSLMPDRTPDGRLTALKIALNAHNIAIDANQSAASPVAVDRVDFIGKAAIDEGRLDIDNLQVMSGTTGVRIIGKIWGGEDAPGMLLSGKIQDLSAELLKQLWPPVMAPKTRDWVNANVRDGRITDGQFMLNLPPGWKDAAQSTRKLPKGSIDLSFKMQDVTSGYFKNLPPLTKASGEAKLIDNDFTLKVDGADVVMPSGGVSRLASGSMIARDILAVETMADFDLNIQSDVQPLIELLNQPDLNLIRHTGLDTSKLNGNATLNAKLSFPMIKDVPKDRINVSVAAKLGDASLEDALPGINLTEGQIDLTVEDGVIKAKGPAKIAGIPSELAWQRGASPDYIQSAEIKTELDGEQRQKLGIDLGTFVRGPVGVTATIDNLGDPQGKMKIDADLSNVEMRIQPIGWMRQETPKTGASMTYYSKGEKGPRVEGLEIKGPGLSIKGDLALAPKRQGLRSANFSEVRLSDENRFSAIIKNGDGGMDIGVKGESFDARPLIRGLFGSANRDEAAQQAEADAKPSKPVQVTLELDRVYANRGEIINGVSGSLASRGSKLDRAEVSGTFLSGQPVVFRVTPVEGGREMRINGRDGGAAIRAANLYSKIAGGQIEFYALLSGDGAAVKDGKLTLRDFEVRNEAALAELDSRGRPKRDAPRRDGPRRDALSFSKLSLPFTSDSRFICIGESQVRGPELGATAAGLIRKSDGAIDIAGTVTPAYALNAALGDIPLLGDIITGGKGQGIIGLTFALGGNVDKPSFQMNPVSAMAPGFLRKFFEYSSRCEPAKPQRRTSNKTE